MNDGARVITADATGRIVVRDAANGDTRKAASIKGAIARMAVAPGETQLAIAAADGTLHILGLPDLAPMVAPIKAHAGRISAVAYSADGKLLATGAGDYRVVIWDAHTLERLFTLPQKTGVHKLVFDSDGLRLAISSSEELITLWNLALVRPELANVGLDWGVPLPTASLETDVLAATQPPPKVLEVKAPLKAVGATEQIAIDTLYRQHKYQEAVVAGEAALKAGPQGKAMYLTLANAYYHLGKNEEAFVAAKRHLALCSNCTWAWYRMAVSRAAVGACKEAIQLFDRCLQINPDQPVATNDLAWLLATGPEEIRDPERALTLAQRSIALDPKGSAAPHTLGVVYYRAGKFEKAIETLEAVGKPNDGKTKQALTQLFLAMSYQRLGNVAKARECFQKAPQLVPEDGLPQQLKLVESIRAEAAALLGVP